ncbi:MAG TPA: FmdB family zinc ribbon protein [Steroidobacteraceae bacterium]
MPFYEYQCKSCGHELEAMQKFSDAPLRKCPHCGKSQLQRLMSAPVFRLKGGGWYETDFKGDKDNQRNLAERPEDAPKDKKDTDAKIKDEPAKDAKDAKTETKAGESAPAKETATPKEKSAERSSEKPSDSNAAKKPASGKSASRGRQTKRKPVKIKRRR